MIRLQRVGRKNDPSFRAVVVDSHAAAKTGNVIEVVGNYDARHGEPTLKTDRILDWMAKGAKVSDTLNNLLVKKGVIKGAKKNVASAKLGKKAKAAKEKSEAEKAQAAKAEIEAKAAEQSAKAQPETEEPAESAVEPVPTEQTEETKTEQPETSAE